MWVRKSEAEIEKQLSGERYGLTVPALTALAIAAFFGFLNWAGYVTKSGLMYPRQPLSEVALKFPLYFVVLFALFYFGRTRISPRRRINRTEAFICAKCRTTCTDSPSVTTCACGGDLEPLRYWRWIEDEQ